ncbi:MULTISPECIES: DUF3047 domain-containing protein [Polaromonas]|uniref:DUF3047 domain-containing protein n=1 Tax=Polaromonas aquatica TaxID=332657 RepID=A0ABW1U1Q8_9BURK
MNTRIAPRVQAAGTHSKSVVWEHFKLPGKRPSTFDFVLEDRRVAIAAHAQSSASMLWQVTRVEPSDLGTVKFSWKLPDLIQYADVSVPEFDDSPVRVVLAFEGDRGNFSAKNAMLSELARLLTGEELPYATLMYVWSKTRPAGSVIINPRTDRIRKLVVESGNGKLNSWVDYERTIRADFEKAFGEAPGALMSVSVMTDSDNTQSNTQAWYGPLTITAAKP